jgi:hypothetical protein
MDIWLNLIPPGKKEIILKGRRLKSVIRLEIWMTFMLVVFGGVLLSFRYILNFGLAANQNAQQQNEKSSQYAQIAQFDRQFTQINAQIFPGITLSSLTTNDYAVNIGGTADNRDDLVLFKEKLGNEKCFYDVNLPLSDLVDKSNVSFQIDFNVTPSCLENK